MIEYRPFCNFDLPRLAEIWRSQSTQRGLMQPMSTSALERFVLSKPTFDRLGLTVAVEDDRTLGFAHAGFGPSDDQSTLSTERGVTSVVMVRPDVDLVVAGELVAHSEAYLRARGARVLFGGGAYPLSPFYQGLYGGAEISGVLDSDSRMQAIFFERGYRPVSRSLVLNRDLASFRPLVDRQQLQIRRHTTVDITPDPPTTTWWEACTFEPFERATCVLRPRSGGAPLASVNFWNMETMAGTWGVHAAGMTDLEIVSSRRREGFASFLLGEALRHVHAQGMSLVEVHVSEENTAARALFGKHGFEQVDGTVIYRKD